MFMYFTKVQLVPRLLLGNAYDLGSASHYRRRSLLAMGSQGDHGNQETWLT
jgi:hypothetical protein